MFTALSWQTISISTAYFVTVSDTDGILLYLYGGWIVSLPCYASGITISVMRMIAYIDAEDLEHWNFM